MAKQLFKPINFNRETLERIDQCNEIIDEFQGDNLRLTLRQLYYVFIGRDLFPDSWIDREYNLKNGLQADTKNTDKNYKRLGSIVADGRVAGLIDWDAIEDRGRVPEVPSEFDSLRDLMDAAFASYRLPRWSDQDWYVELWVEKQALAGVLQPIARKWHITLMVNKGYSSISAMYESANRFVERMDGHRRGVLLYLGDHDPSGEDMVRDIADRLAMFEAEVQVEKVALTTEQVKSYKPPPNPAKLSDARAKKYIAKHGRSSWEVDALPPRELTKLIERAISKYVDLDKMDAIIAQEKLDRAELTKAVEKISGKRSR